MGKNVQENTISVSDQEKISKMPTEFTTLQLTFKMANFLRFELLIIYL